ncbi:MAG: HlyD family efflux transporter periplasmic adaptor subunit [Candidatus Falkowbacteria bacterium]
MENNNEKPNLLERLKISPTMLKEGVAILFLIAIVAGAYYWYTLNKRVYSDKAEVYAPLIILSPDQPSVLENVLVKNGDRVVTNQAVAKVEKGDFVRAKTDGVVVKINDSVGKLFSPGEAVVTMINPDDLRLIIHVAENKGLKSVAVSQKVVFTVDAYDAKEFTGTVEEISQTSDQSSVVFSISDKRDEKNFSIKVNYSGYPELLNGMSAKAWIYK